MCDPRESSKQSRVRWKTSHLQSFPPSDYISDATSSATGHRVRTYASAEDDDKQAPKESQPNNSKPAPSAPAPAEQSGDYFIPILVVVAYAGLSAAFASAMDWDFILSDVLGLKTASTEITYDFGK
eukprot:7614104-Pyramimonas_sp.AAC.3